MVKPHLLLTFGDLAALVGLSYSQARQYQFIPRHNSTCLINATTWQKPPNDVNIFEAAVGIRNTTARQICWTFVNETVWQKVIM
jgi:hypothetical protein